jgi:hypothetical protein
MSFASVKFPRQTSQVPNYTMLDNLKPKLEEIEETNDWEYRFVSDLLIRREEGRLEKLTDRQFICLLKIHERYCA